MLFVKEQTNRIDCYGSLLPNFNIRKDIPFFFSSVHSFHLFLSIMSLELPQEKPRVSPIIEAKSLFSKGNAEGAFAVVREAALGGNVMACFDAGFMMVQGIGCKKDRDGGFKLLEKGCSLVRDSKDGYWRADGSVSELFEPQSMDLNGLFL